MADLTGLVPLVGGVIKGITGAIVGHKQQKLEQKKAKKAQDRILAESRKLDEYLTKANTFLLDNMYDEAAQTEAIKRIAEVYDIASADMKKAIEQGANEAIITMQEQYGWSVEDLNVQLDKFKTVMSEQSRDFRKTWEKGFNKMQGALVQRRLGGTEASRAAAAKELEKLQLGEKEIGKRTAETEEEFARRKSRLAEQLQSNIRGIKSQAASEIARQRGTMAIAESQAIEAQRRYMEDINRRLGLQGLEMEAEVGRTKSALGMERERLEEIERTPAWLGGLAGFSGALGAGEAGKDIYTGLKGLFSTKEKTKPEKTTLPKTD